MKPSCRAVESSGNGETVAIAFDDLDTFEQNVSTAQSNVLGALAEGLEQAADERGRSSQFEQH